MAPHRTFTLSASGPAQDGPTYDLTGSRLNGEPWVEAGWRCLHKDDVPPGVFGDLSSAMWVHEGEVVYSREGIMRFLRGVLVPDDQDRFDKLVRDADRRVKLSDLADVYSWLVQEYSGPTGGRPSSPDGSPATEGSSGEGSPSPA